MGTRQITSCGEHYPSLLAVLSSLNSKLTLLNNMETPTNPHVQLFLQTCKETLSKLYDMGNQVAANPEVELFDLDRILDGYFVECKSVDQISVEEMLSPDLISEIIKTSDRYMTDAGTN